MKVPAKSSSSTSQSKAKLKNELMKQSFVGKTSLIRFTVLGLCWLIAFCSRLFAVIRFESIIHEFDPWFVKFFYFVTWLILVFWYLRLDLFYLILRISFNTNPFSLPKLESINIINLELNRIKPNDTANF
mgnify:CR=1 FL=1